VTVATTFAGITYSVPEMGDVPTQSLTDLLTALGDKAIPYPTTANVDIGATYGLLAAFVGTKTVASALSGFVRLAKTDSVAWRNNASTADLALGIDTGDALKFGTNNVTGNPMLAATTAAGQSIPNGAATIVVFGFAETDTDGGYNAATGRYTVPANKGGHYHITGQIAWNAAVAGVATLAFYKNAVAVRATQQIAAGAGQTLAVASDLVLNAADVIDIRATQASGGAVVLTANALHNFFTLKRITT
jgi:hypothetical protein